MSEGVKEVQGGEDQKPVIQSADVGFPASEADLLANDPEYQEMVKAEKEAQGGEPEPEEGEEAPETGQEGKEEGGDDLAGGEGEDEDGGQEAKATEENSEFQDNIIPGMTGKQFEMLPDDVREVVTKTREQLDEVSEKATKAQAELDALLKDPIVQHRKALKEKGLDQEEYEVPAVEESVLDEVQRLVDQDTPESRAKAKALLNEQMKKAAGVGAENARLQGRAEFERKATFRKAGEKLLELGKLAKNLKVDVSDPDAIINTPVTKLGDLGKVISEIGSRVKSGLIADGVRYMAETPIEEIYAQMAVKFEWPLITKAAAPKVKQQIKESNKKLWDKFIKGNADSSGGLPTGSEVDRSRAGNRFVENGVDKIKLAADDSYHEKVLYQKNDPKWFDEVARMRQEGEQAIEDNPRIRSSLKT